jgi:succinoglycan biosynthesis protein ExoM
MSIILTGQAMTGEASALTPEITVCICTYQRPTYLSKLLCSLKNQQANAAFILSVVVVDNDAAESARPTVLSVAAGTEFPIYYAVEPTQNIALARNMALRKATGDFVVFIDDDEIPCEVWLNELLSTYNHCQADGVLGPVLPQYEIPPPEWVLKGQFFERPGHETGTFLKWSETRTGNVLLGKHLLSDADNWFRPQFGIGGEDRDFFRRLIDKGHRFVWCAEAPVYESVPPNRWKRSFMLKRAIQRGMIPQFTNYEIIKSCIAVPLYSLMLPFLFVLGHHHFITYLVKTCDHLGRLLAFFDFRVFADKYLIK